MAAHDQRADTLLAEIEAAYRAGFTSFVRVAWGLTGDLQLATDAVQEGFASAVVNRSRFRGEGTVDSWLWSIVLNAARDARRSESTRVGAERRLQEVSAPVAPDFGLLGPRLDTLSARQREIVFLRYWADLDYATIASVLGIAAGTVSATLSAAHQLLRDQMEEAAL